MENLKMNTEATYHTATPIEVDRLLAEANALRSEYIASWAASTKRKIVGLFRTAPHGAVTS
ncbi:MAG TPA: hypothetical protein ENI28_03035 [Roseobacter sp.]|nr:hypothetical protein [Roseobacter sp.]